MVSITGIVWNSENRGEEIGRALCSGGKQFEPVSSDQIIIHVVSLSLTF
jgi:hypothetical protein